MLYLFAQNAESMNLDLICCKHQPIKITNLQLSPTTFKRFDIGVNPWVKYPVIPQIYFGYLYAPVWPWPRTTTYLTPSSSQEAQSTPTWRH